MSTVQVSVFFRKCVPALVLALAFCAAACFPRSDANGGAGAQADPSREDASLAGAERVAEDAANTRVTPCNAKPEEQVCNGVDDDCDGELDEGCGLHVGGHVLGAGVVSAADGALSVATALGSRHYLGTSSDGQWSIRSGLPRPTEEE